MNKFANSQVTENRPVENYAQWGPKKHILAGPVWGENFEFFL